MKKLTILMLFGMLLGAASGCHVTECWRYAWNSRFHPERNAQPVQQVIVADECDPCSDPCSGGTTTVVPGPVMVP